MVAFRLQRHWLTSHDHTFPRCSKNPETRTRPPKDPWVLLLQSRLSRACGPLRQSERTGGRGRLASTPRSVSDSPHPVRSTFQSYLAQLRTPAPSYNPEGGSSIVSSETSDKIEMIQRKDDAHKLRNGSNFFKILRAGPWFLADMPLGASFSVPGSLQICPWPLLFWTLQFSTYTLLDPYVECPTTSQLHPWRLFTDTLAVFSSLLPGGPVVYVHCLANSP